MKQDNINKSGFRMIGAANYAVSEREQNDYYATNPKAVEMLLEVENFSKVIWEPACGEGHISKVLSRAGYEVRSTDIIYRGFGEKKPLDFLRYNGEPFDGDIITNPPFSSSVEFAEKAYDTITNGHKIAMFLKLSFLESEKRRKFFEKAPPRTVYVFSKRMPCAKNGVFDNIGASAIAYAWFIWDKGFSGNPSLRWIN